MKKYTVVLGLLLLIGQVSAYEYAGYDKFVEDINLLVTNQTGDLASSPSTTTTIIPINEPTTTTISSTTSTQTTQTAQPSPLSILGNLISPTSTTLSQILQPPQNAAPSQIVSIRPTETSLPGVYVADKAVDVGGVALKPTDFFKDLLYNSESPCSSDCEARFTYTNPLSSELPLDFEVQAWGEDGKRDDSLITEYTLGYNSSDCIQVSSSTMDCSEKIITFNKDNPKILEPQESVEIVLQGKKDIGKQLDWKINQVLAKAKMPQLAQDTNLYMDKWAIWKKGAEPIPSTASGLVGFWHMDEASGNLQSVATNNYPLSASGVVYSNSGILGTGVKYDTPASDYSNTTESPTDLMMNGAFTISVWVKPIQTIGYVNQFVYRGTNTIRNYALYEHNGNELDFNGNNQTGSAYRFATACAISLPSGVWAHIVAVYNTTHSYLIVNGTICGTPDPVVNPGTADNRVARLSVGSYWDGSVYQYGANATIDELRIYNRAITDGEVADLFSFTSPIAGYHLDETSGNAADFSGNSYTLTASNSPTYSQPGVFNTAIKFDGVNDVLNKTLNGFLDISSSNFTIALWTKPTGTPSAGVILGLRASGFPFWSLQYYDANQGFRIAGKNDSAIDYSTTVMNNTLLRGVWTNLVIVGYGDSFDIYINGVKNATQTITGWKTTTIGFSIGELIRNAGATADNPYNGTIDETVFYKRTLSHIEVQNLYESGITQVNFTSPANGTTFSTSSVNTASIIGAGGGLINASVIDLGGQTNLIYNNGTVYNKSNIFIQQLNSTHWQVITNYTTMLSGLKNQTVSACGGNGLVTCDSKTLWFTLSGGTLPNSGSDSLIRGKAGGIQVIPANNRFYIATTGITMTRADGQIVCCGPDTNNNWACVSGVCN